MTSSPRRLASRFGPRTQRYLSYVILACVSAALIGYVVFVNRPLLRIEGERPVALTEFGTGATVTHAFLMDSARLNAISVRLAAEQPASLRVAFRLLRLYDRDPEAENNPNRYTELYRWTGTLTAAAGDRWQRIKFPSPDQSLDHWYAFELHVFEVLAAGTLPQISGARPAVSIMASEDNPLRGGKLWVDGKRQPGSLFIRAEGASLYDEFQLRVEPRLPAILRHRSAQAAIALVYLLSIVMLAHTMLFAGGDEARSIAPMQSRADTFPHPPSATWSAIGSAGQIAALSAALALFALVPYNPTSSMPLFPELIFIGALLIIAGLNPPPVATGRHPRVALTPGEKVCLSLLAVTFAYTAVRALQSGMVFPQGFDPCAGVAPSPIVGLECRLQASYSQNYAWENLSQLTVLLCVGVVAALMAARIPGFWRNAMISILAVALLHASIGLAAQWFHAPQFLPKWIMVNSYGVDRFTFLIPHPGHVWLQLAPALALSVWQSNYGWSMRNRVFGAIAMLILGYAIVATGQRGGLLIVGSMAALCFGAAVIKGSVGPARGLRFAGLSFCGLFSATLMIPALLSRSHTGGFFVQYRDRPDIWNAAIHGVLREHPRFGFGYARWGEFARVAVGTAAESAVDTAHSLWVRIFFETGIVGFALVAAAVAAIAMIAARNAIRFRGGFFLVLCAAVDFLICATFEDLDYVRPVIVTHVFAAAVCYGFVVRRSAAATNVPDAAAAGFDESLPALRSRRTIGTLAVSLGVLSLGVAIASRFFFTSGAFEFDGVGANATPRTRWLGQESSIPVYGPERLWVFRTDVVTGSGKIQLVPPSGEAVSFEVTKGDQPYLPMFTRGPLWPRRHSIVFERGYDLWYHEVAGQITYPPIVMAMPLLMTRGASEPARTTHDGSIACRPECMLAFLHDSLEPINLSLELAWRPGAGAHPGVVPEVSAFISYFDDPPVSMDRPSSPAALGRAAMSPDGAIRKFDFDVPRETLWYRLQITRGPVPPSPNPDAAVREAQLPIAVRVAERRPVPAVEPVRW